MSTPRRTPARTRARTPRHRRSTAAAALLTAVALTGTLTAARAAPAHGAQPPKEPVATGYGGAVASVSPYATQAGLDVLKHGGNAVDAAVATAAALGVVEPYSAGIGGGGFFVYYDARTHKVSTIDGRESGPAAMTTNWFIDPATGQPLSFTDAVNSGLSVGIPGTLKTWTTALNNWGTIPLGKALQGGIDIASKGFVVDPTFNSFTAMNQARFSQIAPTAQLFLPGGAPPAVGSVFKNPDLANTYKLLAKEGPGLFYGGELGKEVANTAQHPPTIPNPTMNFRPGGLTAADITGYNAPVQAPTHVNYKGLDVYSIAPPSSGGTTVGEALNILSNFNVNSGDQVQALHLYDEASKIAFADRNRWVGDAKFNDVPTKQLTSARYGDDRACLISPTSTLTAPVAPGNPFAPGGGTDCSAAAPSGTSYTDTEGMSTTHLVTSDKWGDVVSYTLTIEQTGGSAMTVPGRGFLLNNEMTDFDFVPLYPGVPDPNLPAAHKQPRSAMSPTIVLKNGKPFIAVGSPGGATIITTVLQILVDRLDLGMNLEQAIAAPRASQRNAASTQAEPAFLNLPQIPGLEALGETFTLAPPSGTPTPEIGAATGLEFLPNGAVEAAAEPARRGGGAAAVVHPVR
ncbi:gamma-glutamyltransferase [Catenulispora acidiphila DSM 44928]|uniref:Glutathione hydrolase proenzyme n=1 Tax=Catenulispora acidiphila (strain DSM 44928 / JCM 14897 / NBRC 102108 / NRRL B-24433 / ID139908) TaxID=479433 RepID=C7QF29_CATAD|nr:gamma-glutamyltransferase [Catenulispora acidiphila]ACU74787.1 gamma-glutamyltransferase [Catenulispora acidiphila DSM 44928]